MARREDETKLGLDWLQQLASGWRKQGEGRAARSLPTQLSHRRRLALPGADGARRMEKASPLSRRSGRRRQRQGRGHVPTTCLFVGRKSLAGAAQSPVSSPRCGGRGTCTRRGTCTVARTRVSATCRSSTRHLCRSSQARPSKTSLPHVAPSRALRAIVSRHG